ncbi:MAG: type II CRISPR RNA-guided endonuclease Cas9 [Bacteroidales bacterium]|nr:type II CRISPR RNA-guided endonuclease Cas9 [Bacteroidales bacterium]
MKKILGLDLGTNSIGWAVVNVDENGNPQSIEGMGSRIIPMGSDKIDYEKGATITKNADRRAKRSARRMGKRYKMRRNKLLFILYKLGMLPEQFQLKNGFPEANKLQNLELLPIQKKTLQLDSLEHYELREKALSQKIELKELGGILYQYNRLRGYAGGSDDDNEKKDNKNEDEQDEVKKYETRIQKFIIKSVAKSDSTITIKAGKNKGNVLPVFDVTVLDDEKEINGTTMLQNLDEKVNSEIELEIRIKRTKKGENISFALPQKTNWRKQMEETEMILKEKNIFPCQLFVDDLRKNKWTKIRNRVILRQQYMKEFDAVWDEQSKHYVFLNNCSKEILQEILGYIFPGQSETQKQLRETGLKNGLKYVIKEQVIYYQRPLKPQTELIGKCQFEKDEKVIPTSHPLFQEFRCWDQINRLFITSKQNVWNERKQKDVLQYTNRYLTDEQKLSLYRKLQVQKQMGFNDVAKIVNLKTDSSEYLNGLNVKAKLKGCDTTIAIKKILGEIQADDILVENIWQAIYDNVHEGSEYDDNSKRVQSIVSVLPKQLDNGIRTELALKIAQNLKFPRKYASLSKKAIENILPLMQLNPKNVSEEIKTKFDYIKNLIETGEIVDEVLPQEYIIDFVKNNPQALEHGGLMYAFAASLVYGRHTKENVKPQITDYHNIVYVHRNLRNPIVEQISNETMQVVKSLWKQFKLNPKELEIRVELARDLKNSAQEREKIFKAQTRNKKINDRIKDKLTESDIPITDLNILKYKLYEQQRFLSPYTNEPIEISKLFDEKFYNIDHIIPKSRFFDDSISNKVICESNINEEKDNRTAWEYIQQQNSKYKKNKDGYEILPPEQYLTHINGNFTGQKKKNLLAEKIPSNPVNRQLKDTQYISVAIKDELAKIVGSENVKTTTGGVTDYLRSHWGLRKLFMELTEPRFRQMELWNLNENGKPKESWITKYFDKDNNKHVYEIKGWSKRYDHRHHAIDALVVALSNEKFIKRLNDLNKYFQDELAKYKDSIPQSDEDTLEEAFFKLTKENRTKIMTEIESSRKFNSPMDNLVSEVKKHLEAMIVSQKPKDKLAIKENDGKKQLKIRAALHQETYYGKTNNRDTKTVSISELKAKDISQIIDDVLKKEIDSHRKKYDTMKEAFSGEGLIAFNESRFQTKNKSKLKPPVYKVKIWYSKKDSEESDLQRLYDNNPNKSVITGDNYMFVVMEKDGKRVFDIASLFDSVALAKEEIKEKHYDLESIQKSICEAKRLEDKKDTKGNLIPKPDKVLFYLQQNDLVYMPTSTEDDILGFNTKELKTWLSDANNKGDFAKRIYKVVKFTGKDCYFIPNNYAKEISIPKDISEEEMEKLKEKYRDKKIPKQELNYAEFSSFGNCVKFVPDENFVMNILDKNNPKPMKIQEYCVKIKTDWLGNVVEFNGQKL